MESPVTEVLRAMGGLAEAEAHVHRPRTLEELRGLLRSPPSRRFVLVGGRHSFGDHFLPPEDPEQREAIDTTALSGKIERLEADPDGTLWVRAPGSATFEDLCREVPDHLPKHPPTSDLVTLAGALAACTHDTFAFFADHVRRFTLLTVDGQSHDCALDAEGIAGELYRLVPGSFGALGVVLDLEVGLRPSPASRCVEISVRAQGRYDDGRAVESLGKAFDEGDDEAGGVYVYGLRGATVSFGVRGASTERARTLPRLPLANDATTQNIYLQAIANRAPKLAHALGPHVLREGTRFRASTYSHAFFQRSYARAHRVLTSRRPIARILRWAGVDPRLPVVHQSFVVPPQHVRAFLDLYFDLLERRPELVARLEQQDLIRLPACRWPMHASYGMERGSFVFTSSMSVPRGSELETRGRAFFAEVAARSYRDLGVKTLLLKQAHLDTDVLRHMHREALDELVRCKTVVDPEGRLVSRLLVRLVPDLRSMRVASAGASDGRARS